MKGTLKEMPVVAASFEFAFMGGSMASVVGARFVRAVEQALEDNCPLICFSASGGARMQEALMSLMQMAKTSAALAKMQERGLPYISVMTDPTMGGVSASLAMLGDINVAEPKALIGFAGPRVIEQTVREKLPAGFQRSEFLLEKGAIDMIVRRPEMRDELAELLAKLTQYDLAKDEDELLGEEMIADDIESSDNEPEINIETNKKKMSNIITAPQATSPLSVWLSYLEHLHSSAIDMGLERVGKVGQLLNVLRPAPKVITVSGTNGKGTTCHMLESILMASGLKVGVYSSPHLVRYTERVRIQGKELSPADFCQVFAEIEQTRGDISLTFLNTAHSPH